MPGVRSIANSVSMLSGLRLKGAGVSHFVLHGSLRCLALLAVAADCSICDALGTRPSKRVIAVRSTRHMPFNGPRAKRLPRRHIRRSVSHMSLGILILLHLHPRHWYEALPRSATGNKNDLQMSQLLWAAPGPLQLQPQQQHTGLQPPLGVHSQALSCPG